VRIFLHQLRSEQLVFWRSREAAIFIFIFPLMLFVLLGSVYDGTAEVRGRSFPVADVLLTGLMGYGAANTAFAGLAITLVLRREEGLLKRLRATPLPAATYAASVLASILLVFAMQAVLLVVLGRVLYGATLPERPFSLLAAVALGALAFAGLGVGTAALIRSSEGASAVVNVIVLPMAFLSGSFGPTELPRFLGAIADVLPLKHLLDALQAITLEQEPVWEQLGSLAVVVAWGVAGLVVAVRRFGWEPRER